MITKLGPSEISAWGIKFSEHQRGRNKSVSNYTPPLPSKLYGYILGEKQIFKSPQDQNDEG